MINERSEIRSTTSERKLPLSITFQRPLFNASKRGSSQVQKQSVRPLVCKFLYSKGKLIHSKLVLTKPIIRAKVNSTKNESTFSSAEILELQEFFRNKKSPFFEKIKPLEVSNLKSKLKESKIIFLKRIKCKTENHHSSDSQYISMKSSRSNCVFRVFQSEAEVFEGFNHGSQNINYFVTDNDVDTDEEQQIKGIKNNIDCIGVGYEIFVKEFVNEEKNEKESLVNLKRNKKD